MLPTNVTSTSWVMTWLATVHGAFGVKWSLMLEVLLVRRRMFETRARSSKSLESLAVWSERFKNGLSRQNSGIQTGLSSFIGQISVAEAASESRKKTLRKTQEQH